MYKAERDDGLCCWPRYILSWGCIWAHDTDVVGLQRRIDDELFEAIIRKVVIIGIFWIWVCFNDCPQMMQPMEWSTDKPLITEDLSVGRTYADTLKVSHLRPPSTRRKY